MRGTSSFLLFAAALYSIVRVCVRACVCVVWPYLKSRLSLKNRWLGKTNQIVFALRGSLRICQKTQRHFFLRRCNGLLKSVEHARVLHQMNNRDKYFSVPIPRNAKHDKPKEISKIIKYVISGCSNHNKSLQMETHALSQNFW